ncbi:hypothetical protein [Paraburkholderia sp. GAS42]|uniref:hypothetical protein n=1 Tax=Paraburkholderia sp. GAS42 TaxID=3035135 RepID=UPI003D20109A
MNRTDLKNLESMFLTCEGNRLPVQSALAGEGSAVWAVTEMWSGGDALILQFTNAGKRGLPRTVMMDLLWGAASLDQFASGGQVLRGAAVLRVKARGVSDRWSLETVSEIRVGATEASKSEDGFVQVTQFTTSEGRQFSVPFALTDRSSRGKRIFRERSTRVSASSR